jgi:hypothetical protein
MKRKKHSEFILEIDNKFPNFKIQLLEEYKNYKTPIHCKCKVCGFDTYYDGKPWKVLPQHLLGGQECPNCKNQLHKTHEVFLKELKQVNPNIQVIGKYTNNATGIRCKCKICGFEKYNNGKYWKPIPNNLINKKLGCPCCSNETCATGINDIATTNPELINFFKNKDDVYNYTIGSNKKVLFVCENCGFEKEMLISNFKKFGLHCDVCDDGITMPNKFTINLLKQLNIEIFPEKIFNWSNNKRYDIYIPSYNNKQIIIENHGIQHKDGNFKSVGGKTLEEEQANDKLKTELALANNIDYYIEILYYNHVNNLENCKQSIINSNLFNVLNISYNEVDWELIWENCQKSISLQIWDIWNSLDDSNRNIKTINNIIGYGHTFIRKYLKIGASLGKIHYVPSEETSRVAKQKKGKPNKTSKKIVCLNTGEIFDCPSEAAKVYHIKCRDNITACCRNKKYTKSIGINNITGEKLVWRYYDDFIKLNKEEINNIIKMVNTKLEGKNHHLSKSVICLNTKEIFSCSKEASEKYKINDENIRQCCRNIFKHCGKDPITNEPLRWMYYDNYLELNKKVI